MKALVTAGADVYGADSKGYVGGGASLSSWRACRSLPVPGEVQRLSDCLYGTGACCACGPRCIRRRRRGTRRQRRRLSRRARTCASRTAAGTTAPGKRALLCFADYSRDTGVRLMCRRTALSSGCEESAHGDGDGVCGGFRARTRTARTLTGTEGCIAGHLPWRELHLPMVRGGGLCCYSLLSAAIGRAVDCAGGLRCTKLCSAGTRRRRLHWWQNGGKGRGRSRPDWRWVRSG